MPSPLSRKEKYGSPVIAIVSESSMEMSVSENVTVPTTTPVPVSSGRLEDPRMYETELNVGSAARMNTCKANSNVAHNLLKSLVNVKDSMVVLALNRNVQRKS